MSTLIQLMDLLCRYGKPHLRMLSDNTWLCSVRLYAPDTTAMFHAEVHHYAATAEDAARGCLSKTEAAIRSLGARSRNTQP